MPPLVKYALGFLAVLAIVTPALAYVLPIVIDKEIARQDAQCRGWQRQGYPVRCADDQ